LYSGVRSEAHHAQLHHQMVDEFLRFGLGQHAGLEVALDIDVEEGGDAADRHGGAVLLLHRGEIAEIEPLHRFARVGAGFEMSKP
jgi:hypothetical protein